MKHAALAIAFLVLYPSIIMELPETPLDSPASEDQLQYDLIIKNNQGLGSSIVKWTNLTVLIEGYLHISGLLEIRNCTVHINGSNVDLSGYLNISDLDDDPHTDHDRSTIMDISGNGSRIRDISSVYPGIGLKLERSDIHGIDFQGGYAWITEAGFFNSTILTTEPSSITNTTMIGNGTGTAIVDRSSGNRIENINISSYDIGIELDSDVDDLDGLKVSNCTIGIITPEEGMVLSSVDLVRNHINVLGRGPLGLYDSYVTGGRIDLSREHGSNLLRNEFRSLDGIFNTSSGQITDNKFDRCKAALVDMYDSLVRFNRFIGCDVAIKDDESCRIYYNTFMDNNRDAEGLVGSAWYNDTGLEGNYYKEYNGLDDGSNGRRADDGIGDTNIPHNGRDPYPLMHEDHWKMPSIPELDLDYIIGSDTVLLDWTIGSAKGFILQRSSSSDFTDAPRTWSLSERGIAVRNNPNTSVHFRIRSYNRFGSRGWSIPVKVEVDQRPLHPIILEAEPVPEGLSIRVYWEWVGEDVHKALIYYGPPDDTPKLKEALYPETSIVLPDVPNGVIQEIRAQSIDGRGQYSGLSPPIFEMAVDLVPPPPPRELRGDATDNETIVLNWNPPLIQDIGEYLLYRRSADQEVPLLIKNLSKNTYSYSDTGLEDNTTYYYSMATVDDDGPVSERSNEIKVTTDHFNSRPYFIGRDQIVYLIEDEGAGSLEIRSLFLDDDGDLLELTISESFPYQANLIGDYLWITPHADQSGQGYVEITVSDGEASEKFLIGIVVEPRPDPPRDVAILSPLNGSVILPGTSVRLIGTAFDPDIDQGDMLNVTWTSDVDGILYQSNQGKLSTVVELRPGPHLIRLIVEDRTGMRIERNVSIILSLWGWGGVPWSVDLGDVVALNGGAGTGVELIIENDSPFVIRYYIDGYIEDEMIITLPQRMVLIGPDTESVVLLEIPGDSTEIGQVGISLLIEAETMNGTYAGTSIINDEVVPVVNGGGDDPDLWIPIILIISTIILIGLLVYFFYISRRGNGRNLTLMDD